jgi:predicted amidophosphoribosyltransferase
MVCPDCGTKAMSFAEYCNKCGADLHQAQRNAKKSKLKILFWTF